MASDGRRVGIDTSTEATFLHVIPNNGIQDCKCVGEACALDHEGRNPDKLLVSWSYLTTTDLELMNLDTSGCGLEPEFHAKGSIELLSIVDCRQCPRIDFLDGSVIPFVRRADAGDLDVVLKPI